MKPAKYWQERSEQVLLAAERQGAEQNRALIRFYAETSRQLQKEIDAFYGRYATENRITPEEARKRLTATELKGFQEELRFYLAEAERLGLSLRHRRYLRALSGRAYLSRQEELLAQSRHQVEVLFTKEESGFKETLSGVYTDSYYHTVFDIQKGLGFGFNFARMDTAQVEYLLRKPWLGENYSDRLWTNKARLLRQLEQTVPQAFSLGINSRVLGERVAERLGVSLNAGRTLLRTEVNHAANESAKRSYHACGVEEYDYLASLDRRTCPTCAALDGKTFRVADAQTGVNFPPIHPNDRCTTVPSFKPDEFDEPSFRAARSTDGRYYTIPADMNYEAWFKRQETAWKKMDV
ncbi:MAG: minor capsid protein [Oscillospiraceae bacterium]